MPKLNTTVKSVRIDNGSLNELEQRLGGKTINAWLNEKIEEEISGKPIEKQPECVSEYGISSEVLSEINEMVTLMGGTAGEFIEDVKNKLVEGIICSENGKIAGLPTIDTTRFEEVCHDKCLDPQTVLEKATKAVERGTL